MKRRYKAGDWLRIPLGGDRDALALIARSCRSRLFGYFFPFPPEQTPTHDELRALTPSGAIAAMLFGGAAIEHGRWEIVATSVAFDERVWPFPAFTSRGAFGTSWTRVRYDPQTMQIIDRTPIDPEHARDLPDARFAHAHEVEMALRGAIAGAPAVGPHGVFEIRSPIDPARLAAIRDGDTIQFSTPLHRPDIDRLRDILQMRPGIRLRVHGFRRGLDARQIAALTPLRDLTLDVHAVEHDGALGELDSLRSLRIGSMRIDLSFLDMLPALYQLQLHGTRGDLAAVRRLRSLHELALENTAPLDFAGMAGAATVRRLTLAHGDYDVCGLDALTALRRLELRALPLTHLPACALLHLDSLALCNLTSLEDISPVAHARSLRELVIAGMPQLNVQHFAPLQGFATLREVRIDVGSRRKEREIYRLLRCGNS